jgi:DNA-binding GntR family transcriptional regulator
VDLAQQFGVAVLTGRKALGVLVGEGIAYRSVGMGTYVAESRHGR